MFIFAFVSLAWRERFGKKEGNADVMFKSLLPLFSSSYFMFWGLIFRSLNIKSMESNREIRQRQ